MSQSAIEIQGVTYRYPGAPACALEGIDLRIEPGEMLAVVGPNGGGKSTLLSLIMGLAEPTKGSIRVLGDDPPRARASGKLAGVLQRDSIERRVPMRARDVVELAGATGSPPWASADPAEAERALAQAGAEDLGDRPIARLSRGQLQRVLLARALAAKPEILILDEPLVGVDAAGCAEFSRTLSDVHRELGLTVILVSHDLRTIATGGGACDRVACLNRTLHFHAAPSGITPQILAEVFHHDLAAIFPDVHVDAHEADDCNSAHPHAGAHGEISGGA